MEIKIISFRLLLFSIIIAFVFISFKTLSYRSNNLMQLTVCNEQDQVDVYIRYRGNDFLINPNSLKNVSYCLGKSMPFYDRTIEYIINPTSTFEKAIKERYEVMHIVRNNSIVLGEYNLNLSSKKVVVSKDKGNLTIFKRPVKSLGDLYSKGPSKVLWFIRPRSSDIIEGLLTKSGLESQVLMNGESVDYNF